MSVLEPAPAPEFVFRTPWLAVSGRVSVRVLVVCAGLGALVVGVFVWSMTLGDYPLAVADVVRSVLGRGDEANDFIVRDLRLPRALVTVFAGAAFGLAGALFQRVVRNPLATPDIIGINGGAAAGAVFAIVILRAGSAVTTSFALGGAFAAGITIYLLAWRNGISGYRLVLIGIGMAAVCASTVSYLLTRAQIYDAARAVVWITGSVNGRTWDHVRPLGWALAVLIPAALALAPQLRQLELGDDAARGLGVRVEAARGALLLIAVSLAAVATASAGPVAFIALVAPQVARRLTVDRSLALVPAALCGALLLLASDLVGRRIFAPTELPVGVVTAVLGAPYLLYLLARANRIGSGG